MRSTAVLFLILLLAPHAEQQLPILTGKPKKNAEIQVAKAFEDSRELVGAPKLKRVPASLAEAELVCTAATTGKAVHDPRWGGLATYVTSDLASAESIMGSPILLDKSKGWSRYSVVVNVDLSSSRLAVQYRVGIALRESSVDEFLAPLAYDNPARDSKDWKDQVALPCKGARP